MCAAERLGPPTIFGRIRGSADIACDCQGVVDAARDFALAARPTSAWGSIWREVAADQARAVAQGWDIRVRKFTAHLQGHHADENNALCDIQVNRHADALVGRVALEFSRNEVSEAAILRVRREATEAGRAIAIMLASYPPAKEVFAAFDRRGLTRRLRGERHSLTRWGDLTRCNTCFGAFANAHTRAAQGPCEALPAG